MTQHHPEQPFAYGQHTAPQDDNLLPGQNDPSQAHASIQAALDSQRERTGSVTGEQPVAEEDRYGELTTLADLEAEAEKVITNVKEMDLPEEYRPGWSFVINCIIEGPQLERYTEQSKKKGQRGSDADIDSTQLNCRILLNHVIEIRKNGSPLLDERGKPIKLNSPEFIRTMKKDTALEALRRFLWDSHIGALADKVMQESGYNRDGGRWIQVKSVNPTRG